MASILLVVLGVAIALFVTQAVRIELTSLGIILALALTGILDPHEALSGFSSTATVTVAAMLVLSGGMRKTGVVGYASHLLGRLAGGGSTRLLLVVGGVAAAFSAFMNNTPVVAFMIPVVLNLSTRFGLAPSQFLIPLSYLSILGGTCTLIGTSTNVLIDALYREAGGPGFTMFEFSGLGLLTLLIGGALILVTAPWLLPKRPSLSQMLQARGEQDFVTELMVCEGARLVGRPLAAALLPQQGGGRVLELIRDEEAILRPDPSLEIRAGDRLLVEADASTIGHLTSQKGVDYATVVADDQRVKISRVDLRMVEGVVPPNSSYLGRKVSDLGLSRLHGVSVMAVRRLDRHHSYRIREMRLHAGDVMLLQGEEAALFGLEEGGDLILIEGSERSIVVPRKAPVALAILFAVVLAASLGLVPIVFAALGGVLALVASRCLSLREATRSLDPSVLLLLAGTIPLGLAMEKTGVAASAANWVAAQVVGAGPTALVGALYLLTSVLTSFLSNNATAVLLTPIVLGIAAEIGCDPKPLVLTILFGASASFATPIGYQTNVLVMAPGGYKFRDYLRIGVPLNLVLAVATALLIPWLWPL